MAVAVGALRFDEPDELLASGPTFEQKMALSDLDGFLTAVAVGPEPIAPSEWMRRLCPGGPSEFDSEEQRLLFEYVLMDRFDAILDTVAHNPGIYEPDIHEDPETGETTVDAWVGGFLGGIRLRGRAWQAVIRSEVGQKHFTPIAVFIRDEDGNYLLNGPELDQARAVASDELGDAVVGMYRFFKKNRHYFKGAAKLGRNDPCFCGSGSKFKKCCGAGR
jgi:uncharacterized protein